MRDELLSHYKTTCPCCGSREADIVYTFWVRCGVCTDSTCKREVPLHRDYIVALRTPSIRYRRDTECPRCERKFDWEIEPAILVAEPQMRVLRRRRTQLNPLGFLGHARGAVSLVSSTGATQFGQEGPQESPAHRAAVSAL
jgi:hypothetical protein